MKAGETMNGMTRLTGAFLAAAWALEIGFDIAQNPEGWPGFALFVGAGGVLGFAWVAFDFARGKNVF